MDQRDSIDFANADIKKLFSRFFFPTLFGMLFSMAFIFTDGIFVGHGIGPHGLAAINLVGPIMMLISGLGMMLGIGSSVVAAIHLSHGNIKAARINVTQAFLAGISLSMLMGIVCYCFPNAVLSLLGVESAMHDAAYEYYIWFIPTCLLMMVQTIGLFVIRLDGSPRYAMFANIIPAIVNIALDYIFIFPCNWGLMGASLATDIGGATAVIMVLYYMIFRSKTLKLYRLKTSKTSMLLTMRNIGYMARMGASGLVGELAVAAMMLTGNIMFNRYLGTDGVSAYSIACYLFPLIYMICNAIAQSAQPIISFNHGAQKALRVHQTVAFSIIISIVTGIILTLLFIFLSPSIVHIFLNDGTQAGSIASDGLPYYATGFVSLAINISIIGYYQSIEQATTAVILTVLRGVVFLVLAFLLLPRFFDTVGLWLAIPVAELCTTATICLIQLLKKRNTKQN